MFLSWRTGSVALLALLIQPGVFRGQEPRVGLPWDWSNRQVVFSTPQSYAAAAAVALDPRYRLMLLQRSHVLRLPDDPGVAALAAIRQFGKRHRDWGQSMNNVAVRQVGIESGIFPAKYSFNTSNPTPNCDNDYVVFTLNSSSSSGFNIVGFNHLYVNSAGTGFCSGTSPAPVFAYNGSRNGGGLPSSPTLSLDGTQIAFLESSSPAQFTVLKWKSGNVVAASWPTPFNSSPLPSCTASSPAPCEYSVALSHSIDVGQSAFIDYINDIAYIVDNQGFLSAVSPVFKGGQPAVIWSFRVGQQGPYTSPVYDSVSKNVFLADGLCKAYFVRTTSSSLGSCVSGSPPCTGNVSPTLSAQPGGLTTSPVVDSTTKKVLYFSANGDGTNAKLIQYDTTLGSTTSVNMGPQSSQSIFTGTFDNNYFTSVATGKYYMCGFGTDNSPALYAVGFNASGTMSSAVSGPLPLTSPPQAIPCSPMTEVFNQTGSTDWLFVGVGTSCSSVINGGCVESLRITTGFPSSIVTQVSESGGVSGIIVDNVQNSNAAATNIYFMTLSGQTCPTYAGGTHTGSGNCAVKLTQSGLN
jgi:hypothetical protein